MNKSKPNQRIGMLINDAARLIKRNFNRQVQDLGLTQAQWQILLRLSQMEGARQAKLAELLELQPISVARLIDRMEISGWVERRPDPGDRRAVNLYLTPKAQPIIEEMMNRAAETKKVAFAGISQAEQELVCGIMQKIRDNLTAAESE